MSVSMSGGNHEPPGAEAECCRGQRDRMRDREGRDNEDELTEAAEGEHEAEDEEQVVRAVEDV